MNFPKISVNTINFFVDNLPKKLLLKHLIESLNSSLQISVRYISVSHDRSSHRRCPVKKAAPKRFAIFTGKHLCLFSLQAYMCVPLNIAKILKTPILKNICDRLLLS